MKNYKRPFYLLLICFVILLNLCRELYKTARELETRVKELETEIYFETSNCVL